MKMEVKILFVLSVLSFFLCVLCASFVEHNVNSGVLAKSSMVTLIFGIVFFIFGVNAYTQDLNEIDWCEHSEAQ